MVRGASELFVASSYFLQRISNFVGIGRFCSLVTPKLLHFRVKGHPSNDIQLLFPMLF